MRRYKKVQFPVMDLPVAADYLVIFATGLMEDDRFLVEFAMTDDCDVADAEFGPFAPNGKQVVISATSNPVILRVPGFYRVVPDGVIESPDVQFFHRVVGEVRRSHGSNY